MPPHPVRARGGPGCQATMQQCNDAASQVLYVPPRISSPCDVVMIERMVAVDHVRELVPVTWATTSAMSAVYYVGERSPSAQRLNLSKQGPKIERAKPISRVYLQTEPTTERFARENSDCPCTRFMFIKHGIPHTGLTEHAVANRQGAYVASSKQTRS